MSHGRRDWKNWRTVQRLWPWRSWHYNGRLCIGKTFKWGKKCHVGAGQTRHVSEERVSVKQLKHTTTLFTLSDHYILSRKWKAFVDQVQTNYHGRPIWCYNQSGVIELLIVRDPHYGRVCFKSVKTLGALHSQLWNKPRLYPIQNLPCTTYVLQVYRMCVAIHILWEQIRYRR